MIQIAKPFLGEEEAKAVREVILSGWVTQGPKVREFEEKFSAFVGAKCACAVSSCTTALHLALLAVGVKPGDVVITVSHSFIATANAIRHCGAEPVFVDIAPDTFNILPSSLRKVIKEDCELREGELFYRYVSKIAVGESPLCLLQGGHCVGIGRIAAIVPVHQMGMPCDLEAILSIAKEYNIPVVEDAACAIGSEIRIGNVWEKIGKPHGDIACFSFHPRKILTTGDGGMIVTNNIEYDKEFRLLRQHGMNISDVVRHQSKRVLFEEYVTTAYNYRMTDIQASVGIEQLKRVPQFLQKRREIDMLYRTYLGDIKWIQLPRQPEYTEPNWQSYPVRVLENTPAQRDNLMQYLLDNGVLTKPGIMNAHQESPYQDANFVLPESEKAKSKVILLPIHHTLSESDIEFISKLLHSL